MKEFMITQSSVMEIQNIAMNPKSRPIKSNSVQYQVLFKYVFRKNDWQNFWHILMTKVQVQWSPII